MRLAGIFAGCMVMGWILSSGPTAGAQESALGDAKDRVKQAPTSPEAALEYGRVLRKAGRENDALAELRRGRVFAKGDAAVITEWELARTHIAKRDFNAAMAACKSAGKLSAPAGHVCAAEAHLLWRLGSQAIAELGEVGKSKGLADGEVQFSAKVAEGRALELESKETEAEAAYREAIRLAPNRPEGHLHLGAMLHRIGKDGIPELRRAADLDARDPVAQVELGKALGSDPAAIAAFEKALVERPNYLEALRALTDAYLAGGKHAEAKKTAASLLKIAPNDVIAHVTVGRVSYAEGDYGDAFKEAEIAVKLMPNEPKAKLLHADTLAKKGEIDLAVEAYQKASGLDPLDPTPLVNATYACIAAGRFTTAKAFGNRAALDFPSHAPSLVAQGDALAADGNPKAARSAYESAKKAKGADQRLIDGKLSGLK